MRVQYSPCRDVLDGRRKIKTTQQQIDLKDVRGLATELGLDCEIESEGDDYTITLETGEVETCTGAPRAMEIIRAYAALA